MNYADAVNRTRHPGEVGDDRHQLVALVRYATLAASSHNTQPWKFRLDSGRIAILSDLTRRCPEVDPDDHHLYASLGSIRHSAIGRRRLFAPVFLVPILLGGAQRLQPISFCCQTTGSQ